MPKRGAPKEHEESALVEKGLPCPDQVACGSSDGAALYDDGHTFCFVCKKVFRDDEASGIQARTHERLRMGGSAEAQELLATGRLSSIRSRHLTRETCERWGYLLRKTPSGDEHLAPYRDEHGTLMGVKVRRVGTPEEPLKDFYIVGDVKETPFGRHLWGSGGKQLTIVGGEIDSLTVSQAWDHKFPVTSPPKGETNAAKWVAKNLDWINSFEKVVIGLDMDEPGRAASVECARLLPPGKAFIAKWSAKDPNEMLQKGMTNRDITGCLYNAEPYRPDGILDARSLTERCLAPVVVGIPWPWTFMTEWTYGRRYGEVYTFGAGTGIGKSDWLAEVIASTITGETKGGDRFEPQGFALFGFESGPATSKKQIAGKIARRRFHIPQTGGPTDWTDEELAATMARMDGPVWDAGGRLFINDSFGAADWEECIARMRFLRYAEGVRHFAVDPISALVTGEEDERKLLDAIVLQASQLSVELDSCLYLLSHLTRPGIGPSHEEGGQTSLKQFRGSNGIGMFSTFVFGAERNQQAEDESERGITTVRSLKDRYTGNSLGKTSKLHYDSIHGTLDSPVMAYIGDE